MKKTSLGAGGPEPLIGGGGGGKLEMSVTLRPNVTEELENIIGYEGYFVIQPDSLNGLIHFILSDIQPSVDRGKYLIKLDKTDGTDSFWVKVDEEWVVKRSQIMREILIF